MRDLEKVYKLAKGMSSKEGGKEKKQADAACFYL
jgi:hypothetical protein